MTPAALARRVHGDEGTSLIEVLLSIAIMGIGVVGVLGALATQVKGANLHRDQSDANAVLASAAERVHNAAYVTCASISGTYVTAARTAILPSDWVTKG